jgi:hypothetical protein
MILQVPALKFHGTGILQPELRTKSSSNTLLGLAILSSSVLLLAALFYFP